MAIGVDAVDLERGEALQVLEERRAQIGVGVPVRAHRALRDLPHGDDGRGYERHAGQKRHGCRKAQRSETGEQGERRQDRIEQLGQVRTEVALQLLGALDAHLHGLARGHALGVRRTEAHELVVYELAHGALRGRSCRLAHALRKRQTANAHDDSRRSGHHEVRPRRGDVPTLDEGLHERPHEQHERYVRRERDPLERDACRYVLARFGHHARQPFAEHS